MTGSAKSEPAGPAEGLCCPRCGAARTGEEDGTVCPACLISGALTPGMPLRAELDADGKARSETWTAGFPQLEIGPRVEAQTTGDVYLAMDACTGAPRRLVVLDRESVKTGGGLDGWSHQLAALTRLNHANVARVLDFGELGQRFFWIVEEPEGESLADLLAAGSVAPDELEAIVQQADEAVASSRAVGVSLALEFRNVIVDADRHAVLIPVIRTGAERAGQEENTEADLAPIATGESVGPYRIVDRIGEGGFGDVWLAKQQEPVQRHVAIKIVKPGMDTRRVLARFEAERQTLAMLNHPNIARVLDAGSTNAGRPYFVMEAVEGCAITEHCYRKASSLVERLRLVQAVCEAVQHAHQKGIIHRDLKPSNVLVSEESGTAVPKVIDFGIAKAVEQSLTENTVFTRDHQVLGTPDYMSPEQMASGGRAADSRSDVYSLGVVLYELLTGTTPFGFADSKEAESAGAMKRVLASREAPKPSAKQAARRSELHSPEGVSRSPQLAIPRELDWIVRKALESDPERRYQSPAQLGEDLRRLLAHEPVIAGPLTRIYQVRKFVRRHRTAVGATAAVVVALLVGSGLAVAGLMRAEIERREAEEQARLANEARAQAEQNASVANAVSSFMMNDLLAFANPYNTMDTEEEVTVRDVVDRAGPEVDRRFAEQPQIRANLHFALAGIYRSLSLYEEAEAHLLTAVALCEELSGRDHPQTLAVRKMLATVTISTEGPAKGLEALEELEAAQRQVLGDDHRDTLQTRSSIAAQLVKLGNWEEGERHLREIYQTQREVLGEDDEDILDTLGSLSRAVYEQGTPQKQEEGIDLARERLERLGRADDAEDYDLDGAELFLGTMLSGAGKPEEAEPLLKRVVERRKRVLGESHDLTLNAMQNLGDTVYKLGRYEESIGIKREVLAGYLERADEVPEGEYLARFGLACGLLRAGKPAEALAEFERAQPLAPVVLGGDHFELLELKMMMGDCHANLGNLEEAVRIYAEIVPVTKEHLGPDHPRTIMRTNNLAVYLGNLDRHEDAEPVWKEVCAAAEGCYGPNDPRVARFLSEYGWCLFWQDKFADSIPVRKRAEEIYEGNFGADDLQTKEERLNWMTSRRQAGQVLSEEEHREGMRLLREVHGQELREKYGDDWESQTPPKLE